MSTMTMGVLAGEYEALDELLAESDGVLTPEIEALLAELDGKAEAKIERVALYILGQLAKAKAIKEEEDRLAGRRRVVTTGAESLKAYLEHTMRAIGKEKIDGVLATVAMQKNNPAVIAPAWDEEALRGMAMVVPEFVKRTPEVFALNKAAILLAHKNGQPIPDGVTIERSVSLRIR